MQSITLSRRASHDPPFRRHPLLGIGLVLLISASCRTTRVSSPSDFLKSEQVDNELCYDLSETLLAASPDLQAIRGELSETGGNHTFNFEDALNRVRPPFLQSNAAHVSGDLLPVEAATIRYYTNRLFTLLNQSLYNHECDRYRITAQTIASGLNKVAAVHGNLYRGGQINPEEVDQYYAGKTVTARAFLSTSADPDTAKRFARNAVFQIETEGAPLIDWLSVHPNEGEILLPPGTRLNVVDVIVTEKNGKPFYNVKLRHVTSSLATKRLSISFPALASWNGSSEVSGLTG